MSAERPAVVLALTPVAERAIEPLLFGAHAVVEPLASVGEADELDHELGPHTEAVLLSPDLSGLTPAHCVRARARGAAHGQRTERRAAGSAASSTTDPRRRSPAPCSYWSAHLFHRSLTATEFLPHHSASCTNWTCMFSGKVVSIRARVAGIVS